jgi:signal peptidase I
VSKRTKISLGILALIVLLAAGFYFILLRFFKVPTAAMANTIVPGDGIVMAPIFGKIERGDIIHFKYPPNPSFRYVSRVIGLPGETIHVQGRRVFINGAELAEIRVLVEPFTGTYPMKEVATEGAGSYRVYYFKEDELFPSSDFRVPNAVREPYPIPEGHYFVMGDNRDNAEDSRYWGTVPRDLIAGKLFMKY